VDHTDLYTEISRVVLAAANLLLSFGLFTQCWRLYRTKSTKGLAVALFASLAVYRILQTNYGVAINEWPIILAGAVSLPPTVLIIIGFCLYHRRPAKAAASPIVARVNPKGADKDWTWSELPTVRISKCLC
jgi:uncharacterized protein with PQ loop repeat